MPHSREPIPPPPSLLCHPIPCCILIHFAMSVFLSTWCYSKIGRKEALSISSVPTARSAIREAPNLCLWWVFIELLAVLSARRRLTETFPSAPCFLKAGPCLRSWWQVSDSLTVLEVHSFTVYRTSSHMCFHAILLEHRQDNWTERCMKGSVGTGSYPLGAAGVRFIKIGTNYILKKSFLLPLVAFHGSLFAWIKKASCGLSFLRRWNYHCS